MLIMIKITYLREEDYWLIPLSGFAALLIGMCFYAGVLQLRLLLGLAGFSALYFTTYIIRRGYNKSHANAHVAVIMSASVMIGFGVYLLTN